MYEAFDCGERRGAYLQPLLQRQGGAPTGGRVITVNSAGSAALYSEIDEVVRRHGSEELVFTPPIYAGDALDAGNPEFAIRALREFVTICLLQNPYSGKRRGRRRSI